MPTPRTWTDKQMAVAVKENCSIRGVLRQLNLHPTGANYLTVKGACKRLGLDYQHWTGQGHLKGKSHSWTGKPLDEILVRNSSYYNTSCLKTRLLKHGLLKNRCYICPQPTIWMDKPLVMVMDHINGDKTDNRIANLRLVCPNCASQLNTFAGRNMKLRRR